MSESAFNRLAAQGYNRIPVTLETFADLDTPLSIYLKLANAPNSFLLESVVGGERFGRYSFIGLPARTLLRAREFSSEIVCDGQVVEHHDGNPLDFLAAYQARFKVYVPPAFPRFCGGLAGYFGYETVRYVETKLAQFGKPDDVNMPDILLLQTEELAVVDNLSGKIYLIVYVDPATPDAYARGQARAKERLAGKTIEQRITEHAPKEEAAADSGMPSLAVLGGVSAACLCIGAGVVWLLSRNMTPTPVVTPAQVAAPVKAEAAAAAKSPALPGPADAAKDAAKDEASRPAASGTADGDKASGEADKAASDEAPSEESPKKSKRRHHRHKKDS